MKRKILKIILGIVISIIILIGGFFINVYFTQPIVVYDIKDFEANGYPMIDKILSEEEVKEDIENIIEIMETTHPIFLEEVPEKYYIEKESLLSSSNKSMTVGELQNKISKYLSSIDDGHTQLFWAENMFLNIDWKYIDGKLILLDGKNNLTDKVVTKIGDVDIDIIVKNIQEIFPDENYVAEAKNIENYAKGKLLLELSGVKFYRYMNLTLNNKGKEESLQVEFTRGGGYNPADYSIYSKEIDDNTVYIKLGTCEVNDSLKEVVADIDKYLSQGVNNFIIDVIDNSGGNSRACSMILEALKMTPGNYGGVIKFSPLAQEQRGYLRKRGSITIKGNNEVVKNEDVNLYVLTNENTFSSAQMLAVWVGDGKLGTLIGRPSSNMPSNFGDVLTFQLKNSKILGMMSYKKWVRPDITRDKERVLEPDIYVEYGDDILERALEEINKSN